MNYRDDGEWGRRPAVDPRRKKTDDFEKCNIEIKVAETIEEMRDCFRARYDVFSGEEYLHKERYPYGIEYDAFDLLPQTTLFAAKNGPEVIGTVRIIKDTLQGLPLEQEIDFSAVRDAVTNERGVLAEGSRMVVRPEYRQFGVGNELARLEITYAILNGVTDIIILANLGKKGNSNSRFNVAQKLFMDTWGFTPTGPEFFYQDFDEFALPLRLNLPGMKQEAKDYLKRPAKYIIEPFKSL